MLTSFYCDIVRRRVRTTRRLSVGSGGAALTLTRASASWAVTVSILLLLHSEQTSVIYSRGWALA